VKKKKIYLDYCIKQNPEYIIVDNPLDHLDQNLEKNNQLLAAISQKQLILM
jgi:molybdate transport system ATP-binding protein